MEIEIKSKVNNPILKRDELEVIVTHENGTPKKNEIQQELSKSIMVKKELIILSRITPRYGAKQLKIKAHIYENADAMQIEAKKEKKKEEAKKE